MDESTVAPTSEYCLFFVDHWATCMTKSEWSSWIQSAGTLVAILAAFAVANWQSRRARREALTLEAIKLESLADLLGFSKGWATREVWRRRRAASSNVPDGETSLPMKLFLDSVRDILAYPIADAPGESGTNFLLQAKHWFLVSKELLDYDSSEGLTHSEEWASTILSQLSGVDTCVTALRAHAEQLRAGRRTYLRSEDTWGRRLRNFSQEIQRRISNYLNERFRLSRFERKGTTRHIEYKRVRIFLFAAPDKQHGWSGSASFDVEGISKSVDLTQEKSEQALMTRLEREIKVMVDEELKTNRVWALWGLRR